MGLEELLKLRPLVMEFIRTEVRNGDDIYFWSDIWLPQKCLIDILGDSGTRYMGIRRFAKISEVVEAGQWHFRRCRQANIQLIMEQIRGTSDPDSGCWKGSSALKTITNRVQAILLRKQDLGTSVFKAEQAEMESHCLV